MKLKTRYRIVEDTYAGYEVQFKKWWFPFWIQYGGINTYPTIERAIKYAVQYRKKRGVVKYLTEKDLEVVDKVHQ